MYHLRYNIFVIFSMKFSFLYNNYLDHLNYKALSYVLYLRDWLLLFISRLIPRINIAIIEINKIILFFAN